MAPFILALFLKEVHMDDLDLLEAIEATSKRTEKERLLAQVGEVGRTLIQYALDPYQTYGVKDVEAPEGTIGATDDIECDIVWFEQLLEQLRRRVLTGNEARDKIRSSLAALSPRTAKWFHRVLLKDLNCGLAAKTVNKVFPGLVPTFEVALAEDAKGAVPTLQYPVWVDYKLDGIRAVAIKDASGRVTLYSRKGHEITTLPTIVELLTRYPAPFVMDGEMMSVSWNDTQSTLFATKNVVDDSAVFYNVFDAMYPEQWFGKNCEMPYTQRRELAATIIKGISDTRIRLVGGQVANSKKQVEDFYKGALDQGYEGIMIKDPNMPYMFKRSKAIIKLKPHQSWEGVVVAVENGDPNGKWAGRFGAFVVDINGVRTHVGGGYTDEMREEITKNPTAYIGRTMELKGQEMTKDGVVRFPVFLRWRNEEDV